MMSEPTTLGAPAIAPEPAQIVLKPKRKAPRSAFKPGQSGNPGGISLKSDKAFTDAIKRRLAKCDPASIDELAKSLISLAMHAKSEVAQIQAQREIADRLEGKVTQSVQVQQSMDNATALKLTELAQLLQPTTINAQTVQIAHVSK